MEGWVSHGKRFYFYSLNQSNYFISIHILVLKPFYLDINIIFLPLFSTKCIIGQMKTSNIDFESIFPSVSEEHFILLLSQLTRSCSYQCCKNSYTSIDSCRLLRKNTFLDFSSRSVKTTTHPR